MIKINFPALTYLILALSIGQTACDGDSDDSGSSDLSLTLTVDNDSPTFGDEITINLGIANAGPQDATDVEVSLPLPSGLSLISDTEESSTSYSEGTGIWTIPLIANQESMVLEIVASVSNDGIYRLGAEVIASNEPDPDSTPANSDVDEDDQASVEIVPLEPSDVEVTTYAAVLGPDGLTLDSEGNFYAANYGESKVYKVDTEQNVSLYLEDMPGAAGMTTDNDGNLYLATYTSSQITKIGLEDASTEAYAIGVAAPIALAFDSEGNLWTNNNINNAVTKIDSDGDKTLISIDIYNNSSLTIDAEDNIYVSDYGSGKITKIDAASGDQSQFTNLPLNSGGIGFIIYADGYFYATAIADGVIFMIEEDGSSKIIAGKQGVVGDNDGDGNQARFNRPNGLVASADGKTLYVTQGGTGALRVITGFR